MLAQALGHTGEVFPSNHRGLQLLKPHLWHSGAPISPPSSLSSCCQDRLPRREAAGLHASKQNLVQKFVMGFLLIGKRCSGMVRGMIGFSRVLPLRCMEKFTIWTCLKFFSPCSGNSPSHRVPEEADSV